MFLVKVTKMPGRMCRFYMNGRCLYEEMLNPGYNREWRCRVLKDLEGEYDKLLLQADNFHLDEQAFRDLWERRIEEHLKSTVVCRKMVPREEEGFPFCGALHEEICLFEQPECEGVCNLFKPRKD
ncbi:hypothetical protein [Desulfovibrio sp. JC010]|uniref:hypothetical protein n=1 Tax=Desulfovibrio sp. JC010 TaxID=2593641 RepID=UPI001EF20FA9|nr:hypothetical protein [Desulfovibrio sp. JC010]